MIVELLRRWLIVYELVGSREVVLVGLEGSSLSLWTLLSRNILDVLGL